MTAKHFTSYIKRKPVDSCQCMECAKCANSIEQPGYDAIARQAGAIAHSLGYDREICRLRTAFETVNRIKANTKKPNNC